MNENIKKRYAAPQLAVHGKVTQLTAGGSGQSNEGVDTTNLTKRP